MTGKVHSDGETIWVNSPERCVARFGRTVATIEGVMSLTKDQMRYSDWRAWAKDVERRFDVLLFASDVPTWLEIPK
jgi:hypothetical protein